MRRPTLTIRASLSNLDAPTHVANSRLEMFNNIATRGLEQSAEDQDSDDRSDQNTATPSALDDSDSDSDAPIPLLRRTARNAKFTFASPIPIASPSSLPALPARGPSVKRPKGHPDAPTSNSSPSGWKSSLIAGLSVNLEVKRQREAATTVTPSF
ncbi:hypothetical protein B0H10DRAFT_2443786 [Mycena sp. CBHHK59/15]|nr:hypothetical protein B0H10DRAFT_2443786 [Mycena sp. CBHHK59/15]